MVSLGSNLALGAEVGRATYGVDHVLCFLICTQNNVCYVPSPEDFFASIHPYHRCVLCFSNEP